MTVGQGGSQSALKHRRHRSGWWMVEFALHACVEEDCRRGLQDPMMRYCLQRGTQGLPRTLRRDQSDQRRE